MPAIVSALESGYLKMMDTVFAHWPVSQPALDSLRQCKLVSHRGEHSGRSYPCVLGDHSKSDIRENTIAAFDKAAAAGVWGLELDLRWTDDLVPVVTHDPDLQRVFQDPRRVDRMTFKALRAEFAQIPSLADVVSRFGGRCHLMIEIKKPRWVDPAAQNRILHQILAPLNPVQDYHFISMTPELLAHIRDFPNQTLVPIAYGRPGKLYRQVLANRWGGLCGHYTVIGNRLVRGLKNRGKAAGTGYAASRNCLFREIRRGVDWVFTNNAVEMQQIIDATIEGELL